MIIDRFQNFKCTGLVHLYLSKTMPNIVPSSDSDNTPDFYIVGKHAQPSERKAAGVIGISHKSVQWWVGSQIDTTEAENVKKQGFSMAIFNRMVGYYATSKRVKDNVRDNCIQLLVQSSVHGFQNLFDEMAGLNKVVEFPQSEATQLSMILSSVEDIKKEILSTQRQLTQEQIDKEHYKALTYSLLPAKERFDSVEACFIKFDLLEPVLKEVAILIRKQGFAFPMTIAELTKGHNLTVGEKINVSRMISSWLQLSSSKEIQELNKFIGRKKLYPQYVKPLVDLAVEIELKKR